MKSFMLKFFKKYGGMFAALALLVTVLNVNSTCLFITHQPELPADYKKLRKF
ncbi:MAG: cyclic lactone autoinducer peptide [Oscillospiraceae bacterium]|nr:MAG: cyclic lactone autoinducer peptide [Oscillospiraceae bacterium]